MGVFVGVCYGFKSPKCKLVKYDQIQYKHPHKLNPRPCKVGLHKRQL